MRKSMILSLGIAIFTMLFGAGNIVFPLVLGREVGNQLWFAIIGLFITAIFIPLLGLVITLLFEGNYKKFLGTMGQIPGAIAALIIMILIGPFGATARCITLAHTAVSWYMPSCSLFIFSALAAIGIYALTVRQGQVIDLLGKTLGPIKLMLLFSLVAAGLFIPIALEPSGMSATESFCRGFKDGYFTLDLFCAIFFAGLVYSAITRYFTTKGIKITPKKVAYAGTKACLIGALLLGVVYLSFSLLAARHSIHVRDVLDDHLLNALSGAILGSKAGIMASAMELIACVTTAMALVSVFAEYLRNELFNKRLHYINIPCSSP